MLSRAALTGLCFWLPSFQISTCSFSRSEVLGTAADEGDRQDFQRILGTRLRINKLNLGQRSPHTTKTLTVRAAPSIIAFTNNPTLLLWMNMHFFSLKSHVLTRKKPSVPSLVTFTAFPYLHFPSIHISDQQVGLGQRNRKC